ncbi:50S ribosomal protein L23, partial [Salmonella enterica subsp. enterica]|nr:50S ribosomal protein L23 [Salmonella enterica subsp. enterica]
TLKAGQDVQVADVAEQPAADNE